MCFTIQNDYTSPTHPSNLGVLGVSRIHDSRTRQRPRHLDSRPLSPTLTYRKGFVCGVLCLNVLCSSHPIPRSPHVVRRSRRATGVREVPFAFQVPSVVVEASERLAARPALPRLDYRRQSRRDSQVSLRRPHMAAVIAYVVRATIIGADGAVIYLHESVSHVSTQSSLLSSITSESRIYTALVQNIIQRT